MEISLNHTVNPIANQILLNEIPETQRQIFILKTYHNYSVSDICKVYKINEKQFWSYIHNTRVRLMDSIS